ncbi:hypothetical protein N136_00075 [Leifsonia aquatica ATCC 14665]|uniref:Uncharacterized protein n=2 Tax=Leifsonia aquatica TaxID=144185 RepID=U2TFQ0_LEIAQ|nr:hypothetical protein N136_00075 [Leifsonia aquatica ATCC 14665]MBB2967966.1 hypothetical protein [Leifsonia aquatica]
MDSQSVHVLWKYEGDMQISFGVYLSVPQAMVRWETIRRSGAFIAADGEIATFVDADFEAGNWFVESYQPGLEPRETPLG